MTGTRDVINRRKDWDGENGWRMHEMVQKYPEWDDYAKAIWANEIPDEDKVPAWRIDEMSMRLMAERPSRSIPRLLRHTDVDTGEVFSEQLDHGMTEYTVDENRIEHGPIHENTGCICCNHDNDLEMLTAWELEEPLETKRNITIG